MKPGDHPDFFRLPPPPGRSRESRIVLDASGRFSNAGIPIDHAGMAAAFSSWIRRHPDDGRFILTNGYDWTYFTVVDAPFTVRHAAPGPDGVTLRLSDETEEALDPSSVVVSTEGILYARVKGGDFEARFVPQAQSALVEVISEDPNGRAVLEIQGQRYPIPARGARAEEPQ